MQLQAVDTRLQAANAALFFNEHTCKQGLIYRSDEQQLNAAEAAWRWQQYGGDDARVASLQTASASRVYLITRVCLVKLILPASVTMRQKL